MPYLAALAAGLLLFSSDHPVHWWWLQLIAFVPFWLALSHQRAAGRMLWIIGFLLAAGYGLPLLVTAGTALPIVVAVVAVLVQWPLIAMLAGRLISQGAVRGPFGAAAVVTLAEVAIWYAIPLFGTAQCVVRPLSAMPAGVAFVAWTGVGGLVFVVTAMQALVASAIRDPAGRRGALLTAGTILVFVATLDAVRWNRDLGPSMRVAAAGWDGRHSGARTMQERYAEFFAVAAEKDCSLLVTPETGVRFDSAALGWETRDRAEAALGAGARESDVLAAIGMWNPSGRDNRIWFVDPAGELRGEYRKTHLIPWMESYNAGDGALITVDHEDVRVGGMICQDDNFTDLGRGLGRLGTQLVAVPTNDWAKIREYHLENGIFRAIENGYAVVRATSNGISALISARGEVVGRLDHVATDSPGQVLTGVVATGDGQPTLYARLGDLPIVLLAAAFVLSAALRRRRSVENAAETGVETAA